MNTPLRVGVGAVLFCFCASLFGAGCGTAPPDASEEGSAASEASLRFPFPGDNGSRCTTAANCASGYCIDGTCCATACPAPSCTVNPAGDVAVVRSCGTGTCQIKQTLCFEDRCVAGACTSRKLHDRHGLLSDGSLFRSGSSVSIRAVQLDHALRRWIHL